MSREESLEILESRVEPLFVAYRIDKRNMKEFYSVEEVSKYFKLRKGTVKTTASSRHKTGKFRGGQKWLLFYGQEKHRYIQNEINKAKAA